MDNDLQYLYHKTSLDGLYSILQSGYIFPRSQTGVDPVFSPLDHSTSGDWVYLSLDPSIPVAGKIPVQLVLSTRILLDRNDYFLNPTWSYGIYSDSQSPDHLDEFLIKNDPYSEIIFPSAVDINPYLVDIRIIKLNEGVSQLIPPDNRPGELDLSRIPPIYIDYLNIIEV